MTSLWFRNADRAMSVLAKEGVSRITWTRQHLGRLRMDGIAYVRQFYMGSSIRPRIMLIGIQGSSEYNVMSRLDSPIAVYPTWSGKHDKWSDLVNFIEKPWGEDMDRCSDLSITPSLRPVFGQKHRVVIHNAPSVNSGLGQKFWLTVSRVQEDYPEVELFANGPCSFAALFGLDFKAADFGLCDASDINQVIILPSGVMIKFNKPSDFRKLWQWEDWIKAMGFTVDELIKSHAKRYAFRIRSARWASTHWNDNFRFHMKVNNIAPDEIDASNDDYVPRSSRSIILRRKKFTLKAADKILCDRCRIAPGCKLFRSGSICGYKDSEMSELEKLFGSRSSMRIIDGLSELVKMQAGRLDNAITNEAESSESDPEVTKQINSLFKNGVALAKLLDPKLAGPGTSVQVNVGVSNGNIASVATSNPKEMIAGVVAALESAGVPRDEITPTMIQGVLNGMSNGDLRTAVDAQVARIPAKHLEQKQKELDQNAREIFNVGRVIDSTAI